MPTMSTAKRLMLAFGVVIATFLCVGATSFYSGLRLAEADRWNRHTYNVISQSDAMLLAMVNMETGVRGFLVSGESQFLEPWTAGPTSAARGARPSR